MKKEYRLLKSEDFKKVLDQRHLAAKNSSVSIFYATNKLPHARIGISVSTKVGNAVTRVKTRRQIRAQINLCSILDKSVDLVIIAHNGYLKRDFQENLNIIKKAIDALPEDQGE